MTKAEARLKFERLINERCNNMYVGARRTNREHGGRHVARTIFVNVGRKRERDVTRTMDVSRSLRGSNVIIIIIVITTRCASIGFFSRVFVIIIIIRTIFTKGRPPSERTSRITYGLFERGRVFIYYASYTNERPVRTFHVAVFLRRNGEIRRPGRDIDVGHGRAIAVRAVKLFLCRSCARACVRINT